MHSINPLLRDGSSYTSKGYVIFIVSGMPVWAGGSVILLRLYISRYEVEFCSLMGYK